MLFGVIGFVIGCFVGGGLVFVCFALVAAGAVEDEAHILERYEDDLINRKDAVSRISDLLMLDLKGERLPTWNEVYRAINDIPPAEPEPKMKPIFSSDGYADGNPVYDYAECQKCGYAFEDTDKAWGEPFCPHCGADIDWSEVL